MNKPYTLECCVDSVESACAAERGGATRLELCSGLVIGGLTPSPVLFRAVRACCDLPIRVLLRPRYGDFLYTDLEFSILLDEIELFHKAGADGVVVGCLMADGALDRARMETLVEHADDMPVALHRAFDLCRDPLEALAEARALGICTVLTSGQKNACLSGKPLISRMLAEGDGPEILIGGGVNADVIRAFTADTPARSFHMSGKESVPSAMRWKNDSVSMGAAQLDEYSIWRTSEGAVRAAAQALDAL